MKVLAIIANIFLPGVGSLVIGKWGQGIAQILLGGIGVLLCFTVIGVVVGYPLILAVWIWAIVTAASFRDGPFTVVVQQQPAPSRE